MSNNLHAHLAYIQDRLADLGSVGEVYWHPADDTDPQPSVGITGLSRGEQVSLSRICADLEPVLRQLGADLSRDGRTADGRVLSWAMQLAGRQHVNFVEGTYGPAPVLHWAIEAITQRPPRRRGGRKRAEEVQEVYRFCYESRAAGKKLAVIRAAAEKQFGARAPKSDSNVLEYANRYAARNRLPAV